MTQHVTTAVCGVGPGYRHEPPLPAELNAWDEAADPHYLADLSARALKRGVLDGGQVWLYGICDEGGDFKFGIAKSVLSRFGSLQTGNPRRLRLLFAAPGTGALESFVHEELVPYRRRGEWYEPSDRVLAVAFLLFWVAEYAARTDQSRWQHATLRPLEEILGLFAEHGETSR